jgi:hypothetical protein
VTIDKTVLPEWVADVSELVNIANARAHWPSSIYGGMTIVFGILTYYGGVDGSNRPLAGNNCICNNNSTFDDVYFTYVIESYSFYLSTCFSSCFKLHVSISKVKVTR